MMHTDVVVGGKRLRLSNLEKILYPRVAFTKAQVIDYYTRVAPVLLPHLRDRPLTLKRYPEGVAGDFFYEKECPAYRPRWLRTASVWSDGNQRDIGYCMINDLPSLVWVANLADIELHVLLSTKKDVQRPTTLAFDLDPGAPADIVECAVVALHLKRALDEWGLRAFAKTSGSKGMQVYVPLNTPITYDTTKPFAHDVARALERRYPDLVVSTMRKDLRKNKVLIDWSQNDAHKTTVCVYSLRARERPTVSTPLEWPEVERIAQGRGPTAFDSDEVVRRIERHGDPFAPILSLKQRLPAKAARKAH